MRGGKWKETERNGFASSCREGSGQVESGDRCKFFRQVLFGWGFWEETFDQLLSYRLFYFLSLARIRFFFFFSLLDISNSKKFFFLKKLEK